MSPKSAAKQASPKKDPSKKPAKTAPAHKTESHKTENHKTEKKNLKTHIDEEEVQTALPETATAEELEEHEEEREASTANSGSGNAAALAAAAGTGTEMSASFKNFRHHPDMENFYRFIFENDLRHEALAIIDEIMVEKIQKRLGKPVK